MASHSACRGWRLVGALIVLAWACGVCRADGTAPPMPPTPPPVATVADFSVPAPPRWSWIHWWEANRDPYLEIIRQARPSQRPEQKVLDKYRASAVEALLQATKSPSWQTRASSALALGQMCEATALTRLQELAGADSSESVRQFALIALGLLDSVEAETFLSARKYPTDTQLEASLVAMGLITNTSPKTLAGLQNATGDPRIGIAIAATFALRQKSNPTSRQFLQNVLQGNANPWLANEAVLAMSTSGGASVPALASILLDAPQARDIGVVRMLDARFREEALLRVIYDKGNEQAKDKAYQGYLKQHEAWARLVPNPSPAASDPGIRRIPIEFDTKIVQGQMRASAAAALGNVNDPRAVAALLQVLDRTDDPYNDLVKGMAIISLGRLGDPRCLPAMAKLLDPLGEPNKPKQADALNSPLRGYAALALGLYARTATSPQGPVIRPNSDKACQLLADRLADQRETAEVRTAAALGLGLTARTENLKWLQAASQTTAGGPDVLVGYVLLARGMLSDRTILEPAKKFLAVASDRTDPSGILGRRAAVLGLGLTGAQEVIPVLVDSWELSYYPNREVALAFSLAEAYNVTDPLVQRLKDRTNPFEQAFAARCLGELFTLRRPQTLGRLTNGSNYMIKNTRLIPYQAMANEFLFAYLIPSFGEVWR